MSTISNINPLRKIGVTIHQTRTEKKLHATERPLQVNVLSAAHVYEPLSRSDYKETNIPSLLYRISTAFSWSVAVLSLVHMSCK